jgi:hypothetical protein
MMVGEQIVVGEVAAVLDVEMTTEPLAGEGVTEDVHHRFRVLAVGSHAGAEQAAGPAPTIATRGDPGSTDAMPLRGSSISGSSGCRWK